MWHWPVTRSLVVSRYEITSIGSVNLWWQFTPMFTARISTTYISEICNDHLDEYGQSACRLPGDPSAVDLTIDDNLMAIMKAQNATILARGREGWQFPKICR